MRHMTCRPAREPDETVVRRGRRSCACPVQACAAAVVVAVITGLVVSMIVGASRAGAAELCAGDVRDGSIRVALVVDFGTESGAPRTPWVACVELPAGSTGADLLKERADVIGSPRPRYGQSGIMCALDGYPSSGCGVMTGDGYLYWAYWTGNTGAWVYGGGNPFTRRLNDGDIEGWRFTLGSAGPQDPPPRIAPDRARIFPAVAPPVVTTHQTAGGGPGGVPTAPGRVPGGTGGGNTSGDQPAGSGDNRVSGGGNDPVDVVGDPDSSKTSSDGSQGSGASEENGALGEAGVDATETTGAVDLAGPMSDVANAMLIEDSATDGSSRSTVVGIVAGSCAAVALGIAALIRFRRDPEQ